MSGKHLTLDDRIRIEQFLLRNCTVRQIADLLHVSHTTVSPRTAGPPPVPDGEGRRGLSPCCLRLPACPFLRKGNRTCGPGSCPDFTPRIPCERLNRVPFVCDGCPDFRKCDRGKIPYRPDKAHEGYRERLVGSREGTDLIPEDCGTRRPA